MDVNLLNTAQCALDDAVENMDEAMYKAKAFIADLRATNDKLRTRGDEWKQSALNAFEENRKAQCVAIFLEDQNEELRTANAGLNSSVDRLIEQMLETNHRMETVEAGYVSDPETAVDDQEAFDAYVARTLANQIARKLLSDGVIKIEKKTFSDFLGMADRTVASLTVLK